MWWRELSVHVRLCTYIELSVHKSVRGVHFQSVRNRLVKPVLRWKFDRLGGWSLFLGLSVHLSRWNKMYTYPLRSISIISLTGRKTEEQKTGKNCPLLYLLLALSLFSVCLPCPCWSVLPFVRIHSLYPQSLHLKVSTRTHIMSTDADHVFYYYITMYYIFL